MSRLGQLYLVDMISRAIDFRLHWQKKNKTYMFGGVTAGTEHDEADPEERKSSYISHLILKFPSNYKFLLL
jgi:hypothetical protein